MNVELADDEPQWDGMRPHARLLMGIVHVPQERSLFPAMSVKDNLVMGGCLPPIGPEGHSLSIDQPVPPWLRRPPS